MAQVPLFLVMTGLSLLGLTDAMATLPVNVCDGKPDNSVPLIGAFVRVTNSIPNSCPNSGLLKRLAPDMTPLEYHGAGDDRQLGTVYDGFAFCLGGFAKGFVLFEDVGGFSGGTGMAGATGCDGTAVSTLLNTEELLKVTFGSNRIITFPPASCFSLKCADGGDKNIYYQSGTACPSGL